MKNVDCKRCDSVAGKTQKLKVEVEGSRPGRPKDVPNRADGEAPESRRAS